MYSIIELQTSNGVTTHIYSAEETLEEAMSKYHQVLSNAAVSSVEIHACVVLAENGNPLVKECFEHPTEGGE